MWVFATNSSNSSLSLSPGSCPSAGTTRTSGSRSDVRRIPVPCTGDWRRETPPRGRCRHPHYPRTRCHHCPLPPPFPLRKVLPTEASCRQRRPRQRRDQTDRRKWKPINGRKCELAIDAAAVMCESFWSSFLTLYAFPVPQTSTHL